MYYSMYNKMSCINCTTNQRKMLTRIIAWVISQIASDCAVACCCIVPSSSTCLINRKAQFNFKKQWHLDRLKHNQAEVSPISILMLVMLVVHWGGDVINEDVLRLHDQQLQPLLETEMQVILVRHNCLPM